MTWPCVLLFPNGKAVEEGCRGKAQGGGGGYLGSMMLRDVPAGVMVGVHASPPSHIFPWINSWIQFLIPRRFPGCMCARVGANASACARLPRRHAAAASSVSEVGQGDEPVHRGQLMDGHAQTLHADALPAAAT
eukprot:365347-Chlamydomonas_euryale.AAC.21